MKWPCFFNPKHQIKMILKPLEGWYVICFVGDRIRERLQVQGEWSISRYPPNISIRFCSVKMSIPHSRSHLSKKKQPKIQTIFWENTTLSRQPTDLARLISSLCLSAWRHAVWPVRWTFSHHTRSCWPFDSKTPPGMLFWCRKMAKWCVRLWSCSAIFHQANRCPPGPAQQIMKA